MQVNPYLSFKGQCEAAFRFYEQCLGASSGRSSAMVVDRFGIPWLVNCEGSDQPQA